MQYMEREPTKDREQDSVLPAFTTLVPRAELACGPLLREAPDRPDSHTKEVHGNLFL